WRAQDIGGLILFYNMLCVSGHRYDFSHISPQYENLSEPGAKPDRIGHTRSVINVWDTQASAHRHTQYFRTVKENFSPVLIYIGGNVEQFTRTNRNYKPGEKIKKSIIAINDTEKVLNLRVSCKMIGPSGKVKGHRKYTLKLIPGEIVKQPFSFTAPKVRKAALYRIELRATADNNREWKDSFELAVLPMLFR
ncbi:MAG: hypothetical protein KAX20_06645, partial [Candidatus Omnitrophica bacterium]|nr:hypothetical protein [Candidatus Omnitrophota bacterium]